MSDYYRYTQLRFSSFSSSRIDCVVGIQRTVASSHSSTFGLWQERGHGNALLLSPGQLVRVCLSHRQGLPSRAVPCPVPDSQAALPQAPAENIRCQWPTLHKEIETLKIMPIDRRTCLSSRSDSRVMSLLSKMILPAVGSSSRLMHLTSVLFPRLTGHSYRIFRLHRQMVDAVEGDYRFPPSPNVLLRSSICMIGLLVISCSFTRLILIRSKSA